jgi:hypothetical protein
MSTTQRAAILHFGNPDRDKLVWESARGPVLVHEMSADWLRRAIPVAEKLNSPALTTMRSRLKQLESTP